MILFRQNFIFFFIKKIINNTDGNYKQCNFMEFSLGEYQKCIKIYIYNHQMRILSVPLNVIRKIGSGNTIKGYIIANKL